MNTSIANLESLGNFLDEGKVIATSGEQGPLEKNDKTASFNVPLSIFHYKDYNSDFLTSWYNVSSEIYKEINRACPEKKVLNLVLWHL